MSTFAQDFGDLLTDTVQVFPFTGLDEYTRPQYDVVRDVLGRLERKNKRILGTDNIVTVAAATFYTDTELEIRTMDRFVYADGKTAPILSVERMPDEHGQYYQAVMLGA